MSAVENLLAEIPDHQRCFYGMADDLCEVSE